MPAFSWESWTFGDLAAVAASGGQFAFSWIRPIIPGLNAAAPPLKFPLRRVVFPFNGQRLLGLPT